MVAQQTFVIEALNVPGVLARILLVLARRRLVPTRLRMDGAAEWANIELQLECTPSEAGQVLAQLRRIVELRRVELVE